MKERLLPSWEEIQVNGLAHIFAMKTFCVSLEVQGNQDNKTSMIMLLHDRALRPFYIYICLVICPASTQPYPRRHYKLHDIIVIYSACQIFVSLML